MTGKEVCATVLPVALMARVMTTFPNADYDKLFAMVQRYGTLTAEILEALLVAVETKEANK